MSKEVLKNYRPLCFLTDQSLLLAKGQNFYQYNIAQQQLDHLAKIELPLFKRFVGKSKLLTRLLRLGAHCAISNKKNEVFISINKAIYLLDLQAKTMQLDHQIPKGSRPLTLTFLENFGSFSDGLYYGEYFGNPEKGKVNIHRRSPQGDWSIAYTFAENEIDHIHSLIEDPFRKCIWILTGDFENGAAIWKAEDDFKRMTPVVRGSQEYRSCVAFPTEKGLLYATDSQFVDNSLRLLQEENGVWKSAVLFPINGSCIYGCSTKNHYVFSTSVEPGTFKNKWSKYLTLERGPGIKTDEATIVIGNKDLEFKTIYKNKKDRFPFTLFQFGSITFPTGNNFSDWLFSYNIALEKNDLSCEIRNLNSYHEI